MSEKRKNEIKKVRLAICVHANAVQIRTRLTCQIEMRKTKRGVAGMQLVLVTINTCLMYTWYLVGTGLWYVISPDG